MSENFRILEGLSAVRVRPGMYLGNVEDCDNLLKELIDNSIDEYQSGRASRVDIKINEGVFTVGDNSSRGISVHEAVKDDGTPAGRSIMDAAIGVLHSGTKFNKSGSAIGQNGLGLALVNAVSDRFIMISNVKTKSDFDPAKLPPSFKYNGETYCYSEYSKGEKTREGFTNELSELSIDESFSSCSTITSFTPDLTIIGSTDYKIPLAIDFMLKYSSVTDKPLEVYINDILYQSRLVDYEHEFDITINGLPGSINPSIRLLGSFGLSDDLFSSNVTGSVNGNNTPHGKHIEIFKKEYRNAFTELYGDCNGMETYGLNLLLICMANEVDYGSQIKTSLTRITNFDYSNMYKLQNLIKSIMKRNNDKFQEQYDKINNFREKKGDLNKRQKLNKLLGQEINDNSPKNIKRADSFKPAKLFDAWETKDRNRCDLYVVEGSSAMSDFIKYKVNQFQAVLPLKGVPLNSSRFSIDHVLKSNAESRDLLKAIGAGVDGHCNIKKLRYGKIIIAADADCDGYRIEALVVGLFLFHASFLIESGHVYVLRTPSYIQGNKYIYNGINEDELDKSKPYKRIKGLGSLGKDFKKAVIDNSSRKLIQVTMDNAKEAKLILNNGSKKKEILISSGALDPTLYGADNGQN